jgi:quercetin dioxygenase-like cupin family protein
VSCSNLISPGFADFSIQTSQPGYVAAMHSHPYMEVLHILDGSAEAWADGQEDRKVRLEKGDTIVFPANVRHSFEAIGDQVLRFMGIHVSPKRIVNFKDGDAMDARGYRQL